MRIINHGIIRHRGRRGDNVSTHSSGTGRLNGLWKRDGKLMLELFVFGERVHQLVAEKRAVP